MNTLVVAESLRYHPTLQWWQEGDASLAYCHQRCALVYCDPLQTRLLQQLNEQPTQEQAIDVFIATEISDTQRIQQAVAQIQQLLQADHAIDDTSHKSVSQPDPWTVTEKINDHTTIQIGPFTVTIHCDDTTLLHDLRTITGQNRSTTATTDQHWYLYQQPSGWQLGDAQHCWFTDLSYAEVVSVTVDQLQQRCYQHSDYLLAFHGAALHYTHPATGEHYNLLIPGDSGYGKTTLASAFTLNTAQAYSDEAIALNPQWQPNPIPIPFAMKPGSWQLLQQWQEDWQPQSAGTKQWSRRDGRTFHYWWPPTPFATASADNAMSVVILPHYQADTETTITNATLIETVQLMATGGYQQADPHEPTTIPAYIDWLSNATRLHIGYSDARQAAQALIRYLGEEP